MNGIRINKFLAQCGVCSRRDADKMILEGRVTVNGALAMPGVSVNEYDVVAVDGQVIQRSFQRYIMALNKPIGVTCTEWDAFAEITIKDIIDFPVRMMYMGRLDKNTEGLLLLTNDGELIDKASHGEFSLEKEYEVKVNRPISDKALALMAGGIHLSELDMDTKPCPIERLGEDSFRIILRQGLNRQIRRMCAECGYEVTALKRVRVGNISLGNLPVGAWRLLSEEESGGILKSVQISKEVKKGSGGGEALDRMEDVYILPPESEQVLEKKPWQLHF